MAPAAPATPDPVEVCVSGSGPSWPRLMEMGARSRREPSGGAWPKGCWRLCCRSNVRGRTGAAAAAAAPDDGMRSSVVADGSGGRASFETEEEKLKGHRRSEGGEEEEEEERVTQR